MAKEQFAHRDTDELLAMLDSVAAKTGSRGQVFEDFLTMAVCTLAGGTMEEEYLATIQKYVVGEKGKRPVDQLAAAFGRLIAIMTAINLALHTLYGYVIWGNSLANERKLVYETGFNGKGVIRKLADDEFRTVPAMEPPTSESRDEPSATRETGTTSTQGSLFDGLDGHLADLDGYFGYFRHPRRPPRRHGGRGHGRKVGHLPDQVADLVQRRLRVDRVTLAAGRPRQAAPRRTGFRLANEFAL